MPIRTSDRIAYPSRTTLKDVLTGIARILGSVPANAREFLTELELACNEAGLDFAILVAHAANECSIFRDQRFQVRRDAFGIGKTGAGVEGAAFATYRDAARFAVCEYLQKLRLPLGAFSAERKSYPEKFDRVKAIVASGDFPVVERIEDLNKPFGVDDFVWMEDANGPEAVVAKAAAIFPNVPDQEVPMAVTFGKVPHPTFTNKDIPSNVNTAWDDLGPRTIRGIVWHRSIGSHQGNDNYFRGEGRNRALTDYGIGVLAQDGAALDGSIYRWNNPQGQRSPWANGKLSEPYGDGLAFYNRYGVNAINRDLTSVEISGMQNTPLSEKSRQAIAELTAYWADRYKVSWETFPLIPAESRSFVIWHQEFTIGTGKECPFKVVMDETPTLIERARAILKKYQSGDVVPEQPATATPHPITGTGTHLDANKNVWIDSRRSITPVKPVQTYEWADKTSGKGPELKADKAVTVYFVTSVLRDGAIETWGTTKLGWRFSLLEALAA